MDELVKAQRQRAEDGKDGDHLEQEVAPGLRASLAAGWTIFPVVWENSFAALAADGGQRLPDGRSEVTAGPGMLSPNSDTCPLLCPPAYCVEA